MINAYKKYWAGYVDFKGRSTRSDYWWVVLCNAIVTFVLEIPFMIGYGQFMYSVVSRASNFTGADAATGATAYSVQPGDISPIFVIGIIILAIWMLANILPLLALQVRRLRDADFHWAFIFFYFGLPIVVFILNQFPTRDGDNNQAVPHSSED
ncbi:MAG: DUF805 domain-containing protein [Streptococcaceae bacterium]|nr:DUF805 domain-containing protein [Streptococcaceae bacterium]MCL2681798.1 DUF805 domain-containing protein [Streptococcaceae bacterium]MCL2858878.1 DUF805 domain-containing protein [Streptococcaceae bacterium]